jgi:hypothetical protein
MQAYRLAQFYHFKKSWSAHNRSLLLAIRLTELFFLHGCIYSKRSKRHSPSWHAWAPNGQRKWPVLFSWKNQIWPRLHALGCGPTHRPPWLGGFCISCSAASHQDERRDHRALTRLKHLRQAAAGAAPDHEWPNADASSMARAWPPAVRGVRVDPYWRWWSDDEISNGTSRRVGSRGDWAFV